MKFDKLQEGDIIECSIFRNRDKEINHIGEILRIRGDEILVEWDYGHNMASPINSWWIQYTKEQAYKYGASGYVKKLVECKASRLRNSR